MLDQSESCSDLLRGSWSQSEILARNPYPFASVENDTGFIPRFERSDVFLARLELGRDRSPALPENVARDDSIRTVDSD